MTKILEQAVRIAKQHIIISSFIMHVTKENLLEDPYYLSYI